MLTNQTDIALNITDIMRRKKMKSSFVAKAAGFTPTKFSDLIHGRKTFKSEYVFRLCKALEITPNELFCYEENNDCGNMSADVSPTNINLLN